MIVDFRLMIDDRFRNYPGLSYSTQQIIIADQINLKSKIYNLKSMSLPQPLLKITCPLAANNDFFIRFWLDGYFKFSIEPGMNFINAN